MSLRHLALPIALIAPSMALAPSVNAAAPAAASERRFMLTEFDRIRLSGPFVVEVTTNGPPGAVVRGDGRAIDRVNLRVDGGMLVIAPSTMGWDGWRDAREGQLVIRVSSRKLSGARVFGGGRLTVDRLTGQRIDLGLSGAGRIEIGEVAGDQLAGTLTGSGVMVLNGGSVRSARFVTQGAGSIDASGMNASDLSVQSQSAGDSSFTASLTANVSARGTGAVRVAGKAVCRLSGPGPMSCAGKRAD